MADLTLNIISNMSGATAQVNQFTAAMNRATSAVSGTGTAVVKTGAAVKSTGRSIQILGDHANKTAGFFAKFSKSLGRIAFYRAIRSAIRYVTEGFKQGLEAAYNWSKTQGGESARLAAAMDSLSAASGRMKLQLGAAFGGLIVAIEPILTKIINLVTAAADAITRLFALFNGQSQYKKAVGGFGKVGGAAGGAAKQIKGLLAAWDELTIIGKETGGGGGGGGSNGYTGDYVWADAKSDLFDALKSDNWTAIGTWIANGISKITSGLNDILDKVREFKLGVKLGQLINGLFADPTIWGDLGRTLGKLQGIVIEAIVDALRTINWDNVILSLGSFGVGLAEGLLGVLKDTFAEGTWLDNVFEDAFKGAQIVSYVLDSESWQEAFDKIETIYGDSWKRIKKFWDGVSLGFKKVKNVVKTLFNDIRITVLTNLKKIVDTLKDNTLSGVLDKLGIDFLGLSAASDSLNDSLKDAQTESRYLAEEYKGLQRQAKEAAKATDNVKGSLDEVNGTVAHAEVSVGTQVDEQIETNDLFKDRPFSHGKVISDGTAHLNVGFSGKAESKLTITDMFKNSSGITQASNGLSTPLNVDPKLGSTENAVKSIADLVKDRTVSVTPKLTTSNLSLSASINNLSSLTTQVKNALKTSIQVKVTGAGGVSSVTLSTKAAGGFVDSGQLFVAREAGPELVGSIGGKTAVANNDQIVAGIENGVRSAQSEQNALLQQQNSILRQLLQKEFTLSPSVALGQVVARSNTLYGRA